MATKVLGPSGLRSLIDLLHAGGYTVIGPTVADGTIVYGSIASIDDLPIGWTDTQEAGSYGIERREDDSFFAYNVGPRSLRHYLFPPRQTLLTIEHAETGLRFCQEPPDNIRYAFVGVRACELAAVAIQDAVFLDSPHADPNYARAREHSFTIGVNCAVAGGTCFCASMGKGPSCTAGYDLVVTEVIEESHHEFVVEAGTEDGADLLGRVEGRQATDQDAGVVDAIVKETARNMGRAMPTHGLRDLMVEGFDSPTWDSVAQRCLSCTSCTLVCPTCFCSTMSDTTDLVGTARRERTWDSCFSLEFTYLHGHSVRSSTGARYRQWITHKLGWWHDQFGISGCVGCGRCITWCPVGIDITEEVAKLAGRAEAIA
ncbi:MAG: 4Fe-4S dicluster domain-containing protein [Actinomycetota bacterium]|nr:4Fe-4S dicluster domain-containing protein [Actinomycetota bacterium]